MEKQFPLPPSQTYPDLFKKVHELRIFEDAKTMSDVIPKASSDKINTAYKILEEYSKDKVLQFLDRYFIIPKTEDSDFKTDINLSIIEHIETLWQVLKRDKDTPIEGSSRVPLPNPYIVPGGRFNEIYYWDSYFTMLGLKESGEHVLIESMVKNFAHQIDQFGHIPNGNRTYFLSRSQPPFFALMVELLASIRSDDTIITFLPQLVKEYEFWMNGKEELTNENPSVNRVILTDSGSILNRYYDALDTPRDEMYPDDVDLAKESGVDEKLLFRHIRAACESGWDFSSRWFADTKNLETIESAHIAPIDLNCLLYQLELTIAKGYDLLRDNPTAASYQEAASKRKAAINQIFWDEEKGFYFDYHFLNKSRTSIVSAAATYPLFFNIADDSMASRISQLINEELLAKGGIRSSNISSGQQWDAPNGWAPLQYISVVGLLNYGYKSQALDIAKRWTSLNESIFKTTGKMLEKYNVEDTSLHAGGGEYPVQDGFGWTNGVYLALYKIINSKSF